MEKKKKIAIIGVMMYREKRDLSEKRNRKILVLYSLYKSFSKRSQRKNAWKKIWSEENRVYIYDGVSSFGDLIKLGKTDYSVFGYEVRKLRKKFGDYSKALFDSFYYEKK